MMDAEVGRRPRRLAGVGDNWHMSWAANDKQYVGLCDGNGWRDLPGNPALLSLSPTPEQPKSYSRYYGFGHLARDHHIYHVKNTP